MAHLQLSELRNRNSTDKSLQGNFVKSIQTNLKYIPRNVSPYASELLLGITKSDLAGRGGTLPELRNIDDVYFAAEVKPVKQTKKKTTSKPKQKKSTASKKRKAPGKKNTKKTPAIPNPLV